MSDIASPALGFDRVVDDADGLKRWAERIEAASARVASQSRFFEATLSSIPDFVYAFDAERRFAYANRATLAFFGLSADELVGKCFADFDYPVELRDRLNGHIDRVLSDGVTVEDEVFYRGPTGHAAYYDFLWGPVRAEDGSVELVVGVSRDTSERRAVEEALSKNEARLRAATELAGLGIYSWDPISGALEWDDRLRAMWGLSPDAEVDMDVFEGGIHPDDLPLVRRAVAECVDPAGDGGYNIEYRVIGHQDGVTRHIATSGQTSFSQGRAVGFIGAAIDVTAQRRAEAAIRASEAQFRSFADNSTNLIWIGDPAKATITYRSAVYEQIWGVPCPEGPTSWSAWIEDVHPDDRQQVEHALASVGSGEVAQFDYRIVRPLDGSIRSLRETSFPVLDEQGAVIRIGAITQDLTKDEVRQAYVVGGRASDARRLAAVVRAEGYRARTWPAPPTFSKWPRCLLPAASLSTFAREGARVSPSPAS